VGRGVPPRKRRKCCVIGPICSGISGIGWSGKRIWPHLGLLLSSGGGGGGAVSQWW